MGDGRVAYMVLVKRTEEKRQLGRTRRRWEDDIKICKKCDQGGGGIGWVDVAHNRGSWQMLVIAVMKF
jgi:hypothetical protein